MTDTVSSLQKIRLLKLGIYGFADIDAEDLNVVLNNYVYFWYINRTQTSRISVEFGHYSLSDIAAVMNEIDYQVVDDSLVHEDLLQHMKGI